MSESTTPPTTTNGAAEGPSRRALIAGVAGLVAGAIAQATSTPAEAGHGASTASNAYHLGQTNFVNNTTELIVNGSAENTPGFETFMGSVSPIYVARNTVGAGGWYLSGDCSESITVGGSGGLFGMGCDSSAPGCGVTGLICDDPSTAQALVNEALAMDPAAILALSGNFNSPALMAKNTEGGNALEVDGNISLSTCGRVLIPRGQQDPVIVDANIHADSLVFTYFSSNSRTTVCRWTEKREGSCVLHLSDAHPNYGIRCDYVVFQCHEEG